MSPSLDPEFLKSLGIGAYAYTESLEPLSLTYYDQWLASSCEGELSFLKEQRDLRASLRCFFPEAQSALVFLFPYPKKKDQKRLAAFISAFDKEDYHHAISSRLERLASELKLENYKISVDLHPVLEKDLAFRAGLGFIGKNTLLIHPELGSLHLIGALLLSKKLPLPQKEILKNDCGSCGLCLKACPTQALRGDKTLEVRRCLSAFTLETFKEAPSPEGHDPQGYILGCDRCQDVCPYNKKFLNQDLPLTSLERFFLRPNEDIRLDVENLSQKMFKKFLQGTSLSRLNKKALLKNLV